MQTKWQRVWNHRPLTLRSSLIRVYCLHRPASLSKKHYTGNFIMSKFFETSRQRLSLVRDFVILHRPGLALVQSCCTYEAHPGRSAAALLWGHQWQPATQCISHAQAVRIPILKHLNVNIKTTELHHDKTNEMACAPSKDSDQPGHSPSLIRIFVVPSVL